MNKIIFLIVLTILGLLSSFIINDVATVAMILAGVLLIDVIGLIIEVKGDATFVKQAAAPKNQSRYQH